MVSLAHLAHIAHRNQDKIRQHFQYKETFADPNNPNKEVSKDDKKLLGLTIGFFITILVMVIIFWVVALVLLFKYWDQLTDAAKFIGVIGVMPFVPVGPLFTILAVIIGRK